MKPRSLSYLCLVLAACGGGDPATDVDAPVIPDIDAPPGGPDAEPDAAPVVVLPTGTVTNVTYTDQCVGTEIPIGQGGPGINNGFRCALVTVQCPGIDDAVAQVALAPTIAAVSKGTIATHSGGGGTSFLTREIPLALYGRGWDLAQIAWIAPWECPLHADRMCADDPTPVATRPGIRDAACRPATVLRWIREQAVRRDGSPFVAGDAPMCGHGTSGGSGALWYTLAHYGGSAFVDFALVGASTPFGRIDIGCDPGYASTTVPAACTNVAPPQVPVNYNSNGANADELIDTWFSTRSCDVAPTADELALYARNSIVSPGADLDFATPVSAYVCVDDATVNVVPGLGRYVYDAVHAGDPGGERFAATCVVNGVNGDCQGESVFSDPAARDGAIEELDTRCVALP